MKWTEISKWAKGWGYKVDREKLAPKTYLYKWSKDDSSGEEHHVSTLATSIFNHMTNNKWLEYQRTYVKPIKEFRL